jgi:hypothetical protein
MLFSPFGQPNLNGNLHVDFPMMLDMVIDLSDLLDTKLDIYLLPCPPPHKLKKFYDYTSNFQLEWVAKLCWIKGVLAIDDVLHNVRCKVCSIIDRKPCLLTPKGDTLMKHEGKRNVEKDLLKLNVKKKIGTITRFVNTKKTKLYFLPEHLLLSYNR